MQISFISKIVNIENILFISFVFFPVAILAGSLLINLFIISISIIFLFCILFKKIDFNYKNKFFLLLLFFSVSLVINLFFSNDINLSYQRILKSFFLIFFVLSFVFIVESSQNRINLIFKFWSYLFYIVIFDLIIEYIIGSNIFGMKTFGPKGMRLGSFTGLDSNIGNYFYGFSLLCLSYIYKLHPKKNLFNYSIAILFIVISFLIGERSNFIKTFIIITLFSLFVYDIKLKIKLLSIPILTLFIIFYIFTDKHLKNRYYEQFALPIINNGIGYYLDNSNYGAHYSVAYEIFKKNKVFGVGIKNFRVESYSSNYEIDHKFNNVKGSTHPHQIHFEFLSETGLFGYLSFIIVMLGSLIISLKNYFINKNVYQLSGILFVSSSLIPLIPSGSFFTTYSSAIFWINFAVMIAFKKNNIKA